MLDFTLADALDAESSMPPPELPDQPQAQTSIGDFTIEDALAAEKSIAPPAPDRGWLGDMGASVARGVYGVGETGAKAYEGVGRAAKDFADIELPGTQAAGELAESIGKSRDEAFPLSQAARIDGARNVVSQGVESAATSMTPALAGAVVGSAFGPVGTVAGGLIGLFSGVPTFAAAQYADTMKAAEEKGLDPQEAKWTALVNAASEGGTELLSDVVVAATGGTGKVLTAVGREALKAGISPLLKQGWKPMLKNMGKVFGTEASSELLNSGIQAEANKAAGIDDKGFWDAVAEDAGPVGVASLIFSTIGGGMTYAGRRRIKNALTNPDVHPAEREAAVKAVTGQLAGIDPAAAKVWDASARTALADGNAISLDEDFVGNDAAKQETARASEMVAAAPQAEASPVQEALAAAGLTDKPEWQQATATFEALIGGQQSVEQAMDGQPAKPREVVPQVEPSGDGGDDAYQGVQADAALAPALNAAFYEPAQVDAAYQRRIVEAQAQAEAAQEAARVEAEADRAASDAPFPTSVADMDGLVQGDEAVSRAEQAAAPKILTHQEQKQADEFTKRIANLTKRLAVERNPAARARAEETRAGYEFELRNLTGETAPVLTPEEQARAEAVRLERGTPQAALPLGQGFDLVGQPQDFSQAESAALETAAVPSSPPGVTMQTEPMSAPESAAWDESQFQTEADLIRDYQAKALEDANARGNELLKYVRGRLDASSVARDFGQQVLEDLRGRVGPGVFKGALNGGSSWDVIDQEAKSQGLLAADENIIDVLGMMTTKKEKANKERAAGLFNGQLQTDTKWQGDVDPRDSVTMQPMTDAELAGELQPANTDGTPAGDGPLYSIPPDLAPVAKRQANDLAKRIDSLHKMLRIEKNQAARLRAQATIQGYEQQLSEAFGVTPAQASQAAAPGAFAENMARPVIQGQKGAVPAAPAAPDKPAAPKLNAAPAEGWKGHTTADVAKAFPKSTVSETDTGHRVDLPNGRVLLIDRAGSIAIDREAAKAGGYTDEQIDRANAAGGARGQFNMVNGAGVIQLTEAGNGEFGHEIMHFARVAALTPKQNVALDRMYGKQAKDADHLEEVIADAYNAWLAKRGPDRSGLFAIIRRFFQNIRQAIAPTAEGVFEKVASGKAWLQRGQQGAVGTKYALRAGSVAAVKSGFFGTEKIHDMARKARDWALKNIRGSYVNSETGWTIDVPRAGVAKATSRRANPFHYELIPAIPDLLKNSRLESSRPDRALDNNIKAIHIFAANADIDGQPHGVKLTIKETRDGHKFYDHSLVEVWPERLLSGTSNSMEAVGPGTASGNQDVAIYPDNGKGEGSGPDTKYSLATPQATASQPAPEGKAGVSTWLRDTTNALRFTIGQTIRSQSDASVLGKIARTPEYWKHPALQQLFGVIQNRQEHAHELLHDFLDIGDNQTIQDLAKPVMADKAQAAILNRGVDYADVNEVKPDAMELWFRQEGAADTTIALWKAMRGKYDKMLEARLAPLKELAEKGGIKSDVTITLPDGTKQSFSLKQMVEQMGQMRGFYAPRIREVGDWVVTGQRPGKDGKVERFRAHKEYSYGAEKLRQKMAREGWTMDGVRKNAKLPESTQQAIKIMETAQAIEAALGDMQGNEAMAGQRVEFTAELLQNMADEIKSRGFRSSSIQRTGRKGDVVKGYVEDAMDRFARYTTNTAYGMAKMQAARDAMAAIMGRVENGQRVGGVDAKKEPQIYQTAIEYYKDQFRNAEKADRMVDVAKSAATMKYLAFNPKSALVNMTAMVTNVPAALHAYAMDGKGSMTKVGPALAGAAKDYGAVMAGKKLQNADEQAFIDEAHRKGYDDPQYARDASKTTIDSTSKAWGKAMTWGMWMFGKTEQFNRGATMLAAYRLARGRGLDHAEASKTAEHTSNRAHGIYGKGTMPQWAWGTGIGARVGQSLYVYQKFVHNYFQMLHEMLGAKQYKALAYATAAPMVLAGATGQILPAVAMTILGGAMKAMGDDRDAEKFVYDTIREYLGGGAEEIARYGLFGAMGMNLSGSMGTTIDLPGAGGMMDLLGPAGGVVKDARDAFGFFGTGEYGKAAEKALPTGIAKPFQAMRETTGVTTKQGYAVLDESGKQYKPSASDTALKAAGVLPSRESTLKARTWDSKREESKFSDRRAKLYQRVRAMGGNADEKSRADLAAAISEFNKDAAATGNAAISPITQRSIQNQYMRMDTPNKKDVARMQSPDPDEADAFTPGMVAEAAHPFNSMRAQYSRDNAKMRELEKARDYPAAHRLKVENNLHRKGNLIANVDRIRAQRKKVAESRLPADEKARRIANFDARIKEAMDRAVAVVGGNQ
ncbi:PLxRFG domain-containing protein [Solidesulfovibrio sp.]